MTYTLVSHALCPYVQRAAIALAEKAIAFERVTVDLDAKPDWFTAISPTGKVPLLRVARPQGEVILFESAVICEYIEDVHPAPALHPVDPLERAVHRGWMEFGSALLGDIWGLETARDAAALQRHRGAVRARVQRLERALGEGPYFAGSRFCLVDAVFAPAWRYFDTFDALCDLNVFADAPKVAAWRHALAQRRSVQAAVAADHGERLIDFLRRQDAAMLKPAVPA
jgi:glutathione S-transferase